MMGSRQLEYFRAVARELHFTRAAEALRIAQPALSQQIRKLERHLGVALFDRNNHRVELTPAGAALLEHAERILADIAAVEEEMRGWAGGTRGRIRLGVARGLTARLARLLAAFSAEFPGVDVELRETNTEEMVAGLHGGRLDAATVVRLPPQEEGRRLDALPLGEEPLVLITAESAPLAGRYRVPVSALDGIDLACFSPGSTIREIVLSALAEAGAAARIRLETREYSTARAMASVGLAAAVVPRSIAEEPGLPVAVVRLDPEPTWAPSLAWPAGRRPGPALSALIAFMRDHPELASVGS
ncbi:LysR family transcriptional regulator [Actinomadura nitritigenes]|jgi:DNA-binding transcriptional LysR family regulator|uniref:LysR family transcriptional regulator n=1 Tax=Actinomadura TaxID=1988 RepID=UPI0016838B5E|nr:LysR family transcriptional regulator [Actinomadura sp. RB99]MBD2895094.1 HTH-type transcriptional regulator CynR [Actinomadura sp. RB99]